jgi:plasmid maintenance system killer protein
MAGCAGQYSIRINDQYRLAKAIDVPASRICAFAVFWD